MSTQRQSPPVQPEGRQIAGSDSASVVTGTDNPEAIAGTYYHYTSRVHLARILASGYLKAGESNVSLTAEHAGPDVVWLTDRPIPGDLGAAAFAYLTRPGEAPERLDKTEIRIAVEVPAMPWSSWALAQGSTRTDRRKLVHAGGGAESARHWFVHEGTISALHWRAIEWTRTGQPAAKLARPSRLGSVFGGAA